jgi:RND family efflux transporter MFP subunit
MRSISGALLTVTLLVAGCGGDAADRVRPATERAAGEPFTVRDTTVSASFEAAGIAAPVEQATLSTRLMASVTAVLVHEGDRVAQGQLLARLDARDLAAKRSQSEAGIGAAVAMAQEARTQADRMRALYADSAATRYQLDQAETGLARAEAGLRAATAASAEIDAMGAYAEIRAPFAGLVTHRFVDVGGFVAPGAPIVAVQNTRRLRLTVTVPPQMTVGLRPGAVLEASIEGQRTTAIVEGVVPAEGGAIYSINALVDNPTGVLLSGSAAMLRIPAGTRRTILIPRRALRQEGDLTGVQVQAGAGTELRWVKTGVASGDALVEILSGLRAGDVILVSDE